MREAYEKNPEMTEAEAMALIDKCMKILFYRDARSFNKVWNCQDQSKCPQTQGQSVAGFKYFSCKVTCLA